MEVLDKDVWETREVSSMLTCSYQEGETVTAAAAPEITTHTIRSNKIN